MVHTCGEGARPSIRSEEASLSRSAPTPGLDTCMSANCRHCPRWEVSRLSRLGSSKGHAVLLLASVYPQEALTKPNVQLRYVRYVRGESPACISAAEYACKAIRTGPDIEALPSHTGAGRRWGCAMIWFCMHVGNGGVINGATLVDSTTCTASSTPALHR